MIYVVLLLALSGVVEFGMHAVRPKRPLPRILLAGVNITGIVLTSVLIGYFSLGVFSCVLLLASVYRILNSFRVIRAQMHDMYLWSVTFRSSLWLLTVQAVTTGIWWLWHFASGFSGALLAFVLAAQILAVCFVMRSLWRRRSIAGLTEIPTPHNVDLPSITVAIPARNETDDLDACITALLASNYPKLEILVLDDCSQTTRTPEIIRSFAHDGVRFIKGEEPGPVWLAKNQAYDALAQAASGKFLLFMGVDIRVEPNTLRQLMTYAVQKQKTMLCVLPNNVLRRWALPLIQPMRYVWELALPRRHFGSPPVLSSFWLISRQALLSAGGFKAASRMIVPEAYFANRERQHDGYGFLAAGRSMGVTSYKSVAEQRNTAIRVTYPQLHKRPEMVFLMTLAFISWIAVPLLTLIASVLFGHLLLQRIAVIVLMVVSLVAYRQLLGLGYGRTSPLAVLSLPLAALLYVGLVNYSMYKYEFSEVIWKGRNVCLPVMHVVPHLPPV